MVVYLETFPGLFGFAAFPLYLLYTCNHDLPSMHDICYIPTLSCHTSNVRRHEAYVGVALWLASLSAVAFAAIALRIRAHSGEDVAGRVRATS